VDINKPFRCPRCGSKLPFKVLFIFEIDHITICSACSAPLEPINAKSFRWGFAYGFIGFLIPAEVSKFIYHSSPLAFLSGVLGGVITILLVAHYVKRNTFFKIKII
jgi:DNA-directed RNA polymerase subunit RPC12/RpoP